MHVTFNNHNKLIKENIGVVYDPKGLECNRNGRDPRGLNLDLWKKVSEYEWFSVMFRFNAKFVTNIEQCIHFKA